MKQNSLSLKVNCNTADLVDLLEDAARKANALHEALDKIRTYQLDITVEGGGAE